jgi:hypothetical protein
MSTMLKNVASTEPNSQLQQSFFQCSEAYAELDQLLRHYTECGSKQKLLLSEAKKMLITPIRVSECVCMCECGCE